MSKILKVLKLKPTFQQFLRAQSSNVSKAMYDRNSQSYFTDVETQNLLKSMTQLQLSKVFRARTVPKNDSELKFMTADQLDNEFLKAIKKSRELLQMPPVVAIKEETERVISKDDALKGFSDSKFVFTDITYGVRQSERKVVVRDIDGKLSYAEQQTAKRMNQIYFPLKGRKLQPVRLFTEDENFKRCLDEYQYEFVLDRLTVQYEPYETEFHKFSAQVYEHLNESKQFDTLRSTRHFGPMCFYYAWNRSIDDLLYDMIRHDYLKNAVELIALSYKLHDVPIEYKSTLEKLNALLPTPEERALEEMRSNLKSEKEKDNIQTVIHEAIGKTSKDFEADQICFEFIDEYIASKHALKTTQLELAMQTIKEVYAEKKQLYEGLIKAHGVQL